MTTTWLAARAHEALSRGRYAEAAFRRAAAGETAAELSAAAHDAERHGLLEAAALLRALANDHLALEPLLVTARAEEIDHYTRRSA